MQNSWQSIYPIDILIPADFISSTHPMAGNLLLWMIRLVGRKLKKDDCIILRLPAVGTTQQGSVG